MDFEGKGYGFVRDEEIKYLILFVLARLKTQASRSDLIELVMIDGGFDYFEFSDALAFLVKSDHVDEVFPDIYEITEKGRRNGEIMEYRIAKSVRMKSEDLILAFNRKKLADRLNRTKITKREDESGYTAEMIMDDVQGNMMTISFYVANEAHGRNIVKKFKDNPAQVYKDMISYFLSEEPHQKTEEEL